MQYYTLTISFYNFLTFKNEPKWFSFILPRGDTTLKKNPVKLFSHYQARTSVFHTWNCLTKSQTPTHSVGTILSLWLEGNEGERNKGCNSSCHSGAIIKMKREELCFVAGPVPCSTCAQHHLGYLTALFHLEWLDFITTHPFFWGLPPAASLWRAKKQKWALNAA